MISNSEHKLVCIGSAALVTPSRGRGFNLVELMVAMALGLLLLGTVLQAYLASKKTFTVTEGMSRMQENYRYATSHFDRNLDSGGYAGCLRNEPGEHVSTLGGTVPPEFNFSAPVSGVDGGAGPDTVTITRAVGSVSIPFTKSMDDVQVDPNQDLFIDDTNANLYSQLKQFQVVTVSNCTRAATFMITNDPAGSGGLIQHRTSPASPGGMVNFTTDLQALQDPFGDGSTSTSLANLYTTVGVQYDIRTSAAGTAAGAVCSLANPATHRYCALFANGNELVEGVHDLQVTYGVATGSNIKYINANALTPTEAQNVESVRLTLSTNSVHPVSGGDIIRKQFTKTFRVRNRNP